jgi:hypothetical protein
MDYIDLDWEYPGGGAGLPGNSHSPLDKQNLVLLGAEFARQFAAIPEPLFLTAAVSGASPTITNYDFAGMAKYFRYLQLMTYDFVGPWSPLADHQSNTAGRNSDVPSTLRAVQFLLASGVPSNQIVVGVPLYGRAFSSCDGLLRPFSGGGQGSWEPGIYDYKVLPLRGATPRWEPASQQSFSLDAAQRQLVSYDTQTSLSHKLRLVDSLNLGGVMFWEASGDSPDPKKSLINFVYKWYGDRLESTAPNLCYPRSPYPNINSHCSTDQLAAFTCKYRSALSRSHNAADPVIPKETIRKHGEPMGQRPPEGRPGPASKLPEASEPSAPDSLWERLCPAGSTNLTGKEPPIKSINTLDFLQDDSNAKRMVRENAANRLALLYPRAHYNYTDPNHN